MRISVPGNLLLMGEYLVTLPGGLGIALAIENARAHITAKPSDRLLLRSRFQGMEYVWEEGEQVPSVLELPLRLLEGVPPQELLLDTSSFSDSQGNKRGFGSSAALCVGLAYLRLKLRLGREPESDRELFPLALQAHREFQGGRGSGYDVLASIKGGAHLYSGGEKPSWEAIDFTEKLYLVPGDEPVKTEGVLRRFTAFCEKEPKELSELVNRSNALIKEFAETGSPEVFEEASQLNRELAEKIAVCSEGPQLKQALTSFRERGFPGKALGSGGEIAAVLASEELNLERLQIAKEGLQCRE